VEIECLKWLGTEAVYGKEVATNLCNIIEYDRHEDASWDPFAKIHNVPGSS
jgi:hypothetical protein